MKNIKIIAVFALLVLAICVSACSEKSAGEENTITPDAEIVQGENAVENKDGQGETQIDPNEFFYGTEPSAAVKEARKERITKLKQELAAKNYVISEISENEIIATSPNGETTQYGGASIDIGGDGMKLLPKPNFTYYVSEASDLGGEMVLFLEDVSPKAIQAYAIKVQSEGFDKEIMSSISADKTEFNFHAEDKHGSAIDITALIDHSVEMTFLY